MIVLIAGRYDFFAGSFNGRTGVSEALNVGSIPTLALRKK